MITVNHADISREYLAASDQAFTDGEIVTGAQKLWASTVRAVMAISAEKEWPHSNRQELNLPQFASQENATIPLSKRVLRPLKNSPCISMRTRLRRGNGMPTGLLSKSFSDEYWANG